MQIQTSSGAYNRVMSRTDLKIGEVAIRAAVSRDTVRDYERLGLLPRAARAPSGYRQYPESAVERRAAGCASRRATGRRSRRCTSSCATRFASITLEIR